MKAYEVPFRISADGIIEFPAAVVNVLPREQSLRAILLVSESNEDEADWQCLSAEQFLAGYSDADAIYDAVH